MTTLRLVGADSAQREQFSGYASRAGIKVERGLADVVVICAALDERAALIEEAAEKVGVILCPVPLASSVAGTLELVDTCGLRGVRLWPLLSLRFLPALVSLREVVVSGEIGRVLSVKVVYQTRRGYSHAALEALELPLVLDLVGWLVGAKPVRACVDWPGAEGDGLLMTLEFDDRSYTLLDVCRSLPDSYSVSEDLRVEVTGTQGSLRAAPFEQRLHVVVDAGSDIYWGTDPLREAFLDGLDRAQTDRFDDATISFSLARQLAGGRLRSPVILELDVS